MQCSVHGRIHATRHLSPQLTCWEKGYFVFKEIFQVQKGYLLQQNLSLLSAIALGTLESNSVVWWPGRRGHSQEFLKVRIMYLKPSKIAIRVLRELFFPPRGNGTLLQRHHIPVCARPLRALFQAQEQTGFPNQIISLKLGVRNEQKALTQKNLHGTSTEYQRSSLQQFAITLQTKTLMKAPFL